MKKSLSRAVVAALIGLTLVGATNPAWSDPIVPPTAVAAVTTAAPMSSTQVRVAQAQVRKDPAGPHIELGAMAQVIGMSEQELLRSVQYASATATVEVDQRVSVGGGVLVIPKGTQVRANVGDHGVSLSVFPAATFEVDWLPDPHVERLTYSFTDNQFHVDATGLGPDGIYSKLATDGLNQALLPLLPDALKVPGFDPHDLGHVKLVMQTLDNLTGHARAGGHTMVPDVGTAPLPISSWSVNLEIVPVKAIHSDLGKGVELDIAARSPLQLSIDTKRVDGHAQLASVSLRALSSTAPRVHKGDGMMSSLDLRSITLHANPPGSAQAFKVTADYELGAERGIQGVVALLGALVGAANGASPELGAAVAVQRVGDVKLTGIRAQIDEAIQQLSDPIAKAIGQLHPTAPGTGLGRV